MRQNILLVALSALTTMVAAQQNFTIDIGALNPAVRTQWCNAQYDSCKLVCGGGVRDTRDNDCDQDTLDYVCTCRDGSTPDMSLYKETIPFNICHQAYSDCVAATDDARTQDECKTDIQDNCGQLDPADGQQKNDPEPTGSASSSSAPSATPTAPASSTSTGAAAPTNMAAVIGNGVAAVAAGVLAAALL